MRDYLKVILGMSKGWRLHHLPWKSKFSRKLLQNRGQWERGANRKDALDHLMQTWVTPTLHSLSPLKNYHMAVKLSHGRGWLRVRNYLDENHGIQVNLSSVYSNYCRVWRYPRKEDHPDLVNRAPSREGSLKTTEHGWTKRKAKKQEKR